MTTTTTPTLNLTPARRRLVLAVLGAALGASCPYWPSDVVWVCAVLTRAAEVLHAGG